MVLAEIKEKLEIASLQLNTALDKDENPTEWMRHWDNDRRIAISIHKELIAELQADPKIDTLGLKEEIRTTEKGDYTSYIIVRFKPAELVL